MGSPPLEGTTHRPFVLLSAEKVRSSLSEGWPVTGCSLTRGPTYARWRPSGEKAGPLLQWRVNLWGDPPETGTVNTYDAQALAGMSSGIG